MTRYFLGVCSGTGTISAPTSVAMMEMQRSLLSRGDQLAYAIYSQADVAVARNALAELFLNSGADVFIGIDDDTGISAEAFETICAAGHECVSAIVPRRDLDLAQFAARVRAGDSDAQAQFSTSPPIGLPPGQQPGFFPLERGRTGFYMVRRAVYERLMSPAITQKREIQTATATATHWGFYDPGNDENGVYLSEDYAFFRRVKKSGTAITGYYGPGVSHSGMKTFFT